MHDTVKSIGISGQHQRVVDHGAGGAGEHRAGDGDQRAGGVQSRNLKTVVELSREDLLAAGGKILSVSK